MAVKVQPLSQAHLDLSNTLTYLNQLCEGAKQELENIQRAVARENDNYVRTREETEKLRVEGRRQIQLEREAFLTDCEKISYQNKLKARELEAVEQQIEVRTSECKRLEVNSLALQDQWKRFQEERLQLEQVRNRTEELRLDSERMSSSNSSLASELAQREQRLKVVEAQQAKEASALDQRLRDVNGREGQVKVDLANMTKVQETLAPQLKQLNETQTTIAEKLHKAEDLHQAGLSLTESARQMQTNVEGMRQRLEVKEQTLQDKELQLRQYAVELQAKALQFKEHGIKDVGTAPNVEEDDGVVMKRGRGRPRKTA